MAKLYFITGEPSGDLHAAGVIKQLTQLDNTLQLRGMGGDAMQKTGCQLSQHIDKQNFMGFVEIVKHLPIIFKTFADIKSDIRKYVPDVVILVDYPGFNLRMAKWCKKQGFKVVYYITPQVWAWHTKRANLLRKYCDVCLCILPFEENFLLKYNVNAKYTGNPLALQIAQWCKSHQNIDNTGFFVPNTTKVALLPGSRKMEIERLLPVMRKAAKQLGKKYSFVVAGHSQHQAIFYKKLLQDSSTKVYFNATYAILREADLAIVTSGTATLETALFEVPQVVVYRATSTSYLLAKMMIKVPYISLVNLIAGKKAVPELIQKQCTAENITSNVKYIAQKDNFSYQQTEYKKIKATLTEHKPYLTAAKHILKVLENK